MRFLLRPLAVVLCLACSAPAFAASMGIDGMTQTVWQERQSSISGLGMRMRLQPARLVKEVEIMPTIEYWRSSINVEPYDLEAMRKDAAIGCDARYNFKGENWKPYVGVGFAIHFFSTRVDAPSLGLVDATDSLVKGGLTALGGLNFAITEKIGNFIEMKYHHVTDYRQFKINWGLSYNL